MKSPDSSVNDNVFTFSQGIYFERATEKATYNSKFIFSSEIVRIWTDPNGRGRKEMQRAKGRKERGREREK